MKERARSAKKWEVVLAGTAINQLNALDAAMRKRIQKYLHERLECAPDPRKIGKYLVETDGLYRFRVGDYRLISSIDDGRIRILVLAVGHRSAIYKKIPKS